MHDHEHSVVYLYRSTTPPQRLFKIKMSREGTDLLFKIFIINNLVILHLHDEPLFARGAKWPLRILPPADFSPGFTHYDILSVYYSETQSPRVFFFLKIKLILFILCLNSSPAQSALC